MDPIAIIGLLFVVGIALAYAWTASPKNGDKEETPEQVRAWEQAVAAESSQVGRILLNVSRPISRKQTLHDQAVSPQYRFIQSRLLAAGDDVYGGSVEVFLSVQIAAGFIAGLLLTGVFVSGLSGAAMFVGVIFAMAIAAYPWNIVSQKSKKRSAEVTHGLPEFAELLQMPLSAGMGVLPALSFTADRLDGIVSKEVHNLGLIIRANPAEESRAFLLAGERLGTPEAKAFFSSLMQAHVDGARVMKNLAAQAESLREAAHQRSRAEAKKLPVKLVFIFAMHLLPLLFVFALLPTFFGFSQL